MLQVFLKRFAASGEWKVWLKSARNIVVTTVIIIKVCRQLYCRSFTIGLCTWNASHSCHAGSFWLSFRFILKAIFCYATCLGHEFSMIYCLGVCKFSWILDENILSIAFRWLGNAVIISLTKSIIFLRGVISDIARYFPRQHLKGSWMQFRATSSSLDVLRMIRAR